MYFVGLHIGEELICMDGIRNEIWGSDEIFERLFPIAGEVQQKLSGNDYTLDIIMVLAIHRETGIPGFPDCLKYGSL